MSCPFSFPFSFYRAVFHKVSVEAKDLLSCMLTVDPTKRYSASECLLHPWVTGKAHCERHNIVLNEVQEHMAERIERRKHKK